MLAARIRILITARARKNKRTARMLANARKDHSIPLIRGGSLPRGTTPYPFIYRFGRKNTHFISFLLKKGIPCTYLL